MLYITCYSQQHLLCIRWAPEHLRAYNNKIFIIKILYMLNPFLMRIISFTDTPYLVPHNSSTQLFTVPQGMCTCDAELCGSLFNSQWQAMYS